MATKQQNAKHNFGENLQEYVNGEYLQVIVSDKYKASRNKAVEMIDSGKYKGLDDSCFWILMNKTKSGKMMYSGLIISHDGMQIINDNLTNKVNPKCFSEPIKSEYKDNCMYMTYCDDDTKEYGEISKDNCKNEYPYAMLYKRTFDRVVKAKAKMYGIYSEEEADEFKRVEKPSQIDWEGVNAK